MPCLGICVWREVEWVEREAYERRRGQVLAEVRAARRLRALAVRLAWSTPREGQWRRSWRALRELAEPAGGSVPVA